MSAWWATSPLLLADHDGDDFTDVGRDASSPRARRVAADTPTPALSHDDAILAAQIRAGDRAAVRRVFDQYFSILLDHAHAIMHNRAAAEDIVADIFVSILESPNRVAPTRSLRAYLLWRIRHRALDVLRGERRADARHARLAEHRDPAVVTDRFAIPDELFEAADIGDLRARKMADALATLSVSARTIVLLRLRDELEYDEIALVLGLSRAAVKMRLSRALGVIRAQLEEHA